MVQFNIIIVVSVLTFANVYLEPLKSGISHGNRKKTTEKKPATKKPAIKKAAGKTVDKKVTAKKLAVKKVSTPKSIDVSAFERYKMIEVAAYYLAEKKGFSGSSADYWVIAEKEINKKITKK